MTPLIHFLPRPIRDGLSRGHTACGRWDAPPYATEHLAGVTCKKCRRSVAYRVAMRPGSALLPTAEEALAYTGAGR